MAAEAQLSTLSSAKAPPHSNEAEQSLLGALMLSTDAWDKVADQIDESDFYRANHRLIYRAIAELCQGGQPCDAVTVADWFASRDMLDKVDGGAYLTMLANETPGPANVLGYANIVRERSILRQLIEIGTSIADDALQSGGRNSKELLEEAEKRIYAIADQGAHKQSGYVPIQKVMAEAMDLLNELQENEGELTGVPTGFSELDKRTAGLQPTDLIIVAARPSMGKTTFSMNIAEKAAIRYKVPVAVFSMEMSDTQLVMRLFSSLGQIGQDKLRTGRLDNHDWVNLRSAMTMLKGAQMFIDQTPSLSPVDLRARARRMKRDHDIGLIVIDYLQLMKVPGLGENRTQEISEISRSLKALAKELQVPVIALSQLNRALEQRPDKRPKMADLRESGAIEQDADLILFIYRDEVYNEDSPDKGKAEIIIGKHRNGATGHFNLSFQGEFLRFRDFTYDHHGLDG
ncbi:replicative DNA helicase [Wenzhouxiangella marina]|uniref:Replicative DNA helicase n=1 Tax=Wenzhouxiangella marina TaxID=1579979 RepID=A0A0K0XVY5_9GAMM|nr:replicative DNA helicase [Wenzhouxiangella marina]AKS41843.1 DNA helicase [Wenzhouxiangella marina]MBB6086392.1 replicative DNA helicase [Wenzhouxiangella marina]